jgi:hypothetical protein
MQSGDKTIGLKGQNIAGFVLASDIHGYPDVHLDVCDIKSLLQAVPPNFEGKNCSFISLGLLASLFSYLRPKRI